MTVNRQKIKELYADKRYQSYFDVGLFFVLGVLFRDANSEGFTKIVVNNSLIEKIYVFLGDKFFRVLLFYWLVPIIPLLINRFVVMPIGDTNKGKGLCFLLSLLVPIVSLVTYLVLFSIIGGPKTVTLILAGLVLFLPSIVLVIILIWDYMKKSR